MCFYIYTNGFVAGNALAINLKLLKATNYISGVVLPEIIDIIDDTQS